MVKRYFSLSAVILLAALVSACQSSDTAETLSSAGEGTGKPVETVTIDDLRAYCPRVSLREGTAYFTTYEKGGEGDKGRVRYQASLSDVTRSCDYSGPQLTMTVAAAGKVIPGPKGMTGTITMPIRVAVVEGDSVLYSQLHKYTVEIAQLSSTQFIFTDSAVVIPKPSSANYQVFVGYDEGPYNTR